MKNNTKTDSHEIPLTECVCIWMSALWNYKTTYSWTESPVNVPDMFPMYSPCVPLCVPCMFPMCCPCVPKMFLMWSLCVPHVFLVLVVFSAGFCLQMNVNRSVVSVNVWSTAAVFTSWKRKVLTVNWLVTWIVVWLWRTCCWPPSRHISPHLRPEGQTVETQTDHRQTQITQTDWSVFICLLESMCSNVF